MNSTLLIAIAAVVAFLIVTKLILWRLLKQRFGPQARRPIPRETDSMASGATAAVEDVAGPLIGLDLHPDRSSGPADELTRIKGLGPKAAGQLKLLGITRYAQLAGLDGAQLASLDEHMGVFRGRLERDRWVEQARYLMRGDLKSFEAEFGKLG